MAFEPGKIPVDLINAFKQEKGGLFIGADYHNQLVYQVGRSS